MEEDKKKELKKEISNNSLEILLDAYWNHCVRNYGSSNEDLLEYYRERRKNENSQAGWTYEYLLKAIANILNEAKYTNADLMGFTVFDTSKKKNKDDENNS